MADPAFFSKACPMSLGDIAALCGASVADPSHASLVVDDVASLDQAQTGHITFLDNVKYRESFTLSRAGACIVSPQMISGAPEGMALLLSDKPYKSYALVAQAFYPDSIPDAHCHPSAHLGRGVEIGEGCVIEAGAILEDGVVLADRCWIGANAVIGKNVRLGMGCRVGSCASISHALIGDNVRIYPGVRIGQDGFGFAIDPAGYVKVPQLGRVIVGNGVEIGANTTIDRGAGPDTIIGDGTWIDNLVQIGHNVKIGRCCILVAQSGVAGSSVLEDYSVLAAQSGVAGHLRIGKGARIGAKAGVMRDVAPGEEHLGAPSMPSKEYMRQLVTLKRLAAHKPPASEKKE